MKWKCKWGSGEQLRYQWNSTEMNQEPVAARASANNARSQEQPVPTFIRLSSVRRQRKFYLFIYSRLLRAGIKGRSQEFSVLHSITSILRQRMAISFSNTNISEFLLFLSITSQWAKESFLQFSRGVSKQILPSEFFLRYSITFNPEVKEFKPVFSEHPKSQIKAAVLLFSPSKFTCDYINRRLRTSWQQSNPQDVN